MEKGVKGWSLQARVQPRRVYHLLVHPSESRTRVASHPTPQFLNKDMPEMAPRTSRSQEWLGNTSRRGLMADHPSSLPELYCEAWRPSQPELEHSSRAILVPPTLSWDRHHLFPHQAAVSLRLLEPCDLMGHSVFSPRFSIIYCVSQTGLKP